MLPWQPLAPPGEYDWTVRVWRRCSLMSNYFDVDGDLLLLLFAAKVYSYILSFNRHTRIIIIGRHFSYAQITNLSLRRQHERHTQINSSNYTWTVQVFVISPTTEPSKVFQKARPDEQNPVVSVSVWPVLEGQTAGRCNSQDSESARELKREQCWSSVRDRWIRRMPIISANGKRRIRCSGCARQV